MEVNPMRLTTIFLALSTLLAFPGCAAYKLKEAPGYAKVKESDWMAHYKASDDTGLNVRVFANVEGGTLNFWAQDLVTKLAPRGYTLVDQTPIESKNGVPGARFDFSYVPPGTDLESEEATAPRFYTVALFATDEYRVVVQLAGKAAVAAEHQQRLDRILADLKVRGCDVVSDICRPDEPLRTLAAAPVDGQTKTPPSK